MSPPPPEPAAAPGSGRGPAWPLLVVVLAPILVFSGVLDNGLVNWDDRIYIESNALVTDPGSASLADRLRTSNLGYPLPLPVLIYGWLWRLGGSAWPFHAVSLLVHALNSALLFSLLRRELGRPRVACVSALAFSLHPVVVEPVAWATGLKELLFGTGALLTVWAVTSRRPALAPVASLVAYGSKPASALLGLALPFFAVGRADLGGWRRAPVAGGVGLTAALGLALLAYTVGQESELLRTTADGPPTARRVLGAAGLSLQHLLAPASLSPRYPLDCVTGSTMLLGAVGLVGLSVAVVVAARGRSPALGWLALLGAAYAPVSNLQPLIRFTADSYLYVPWMASCAAMGHGWCRLEPLLTGERARVGTLLARLPLLVLPLWAVLSVIQVETWRDTTRLWAEAHAAFPRDGELVYRYGDALGRGGDLAAELALYAEHEEALATSPKIPVALVASLEQAEAFEELDRWYARAFASQVRQDDGVYWHYVEYVARHPARHAPAHDAALRHAIQVYLAAPARASLDAEERARVAASARRLGLTEAARTLATAPQSP